MLGAAGASALLACWHPRQLFAQAVVPTTAPPRPSTAAMPLARLLEVEVETAVALTAMAAFYRGQLGFDLVEENPQRLSFRVGATRLSFVPSTADRQPLYHFAFNIPRNKILAARDWHLKRASLIPAWGDLGEPGQPPEVVHFRHWNAQSLFFYDPAHNIVEYIARHSLATERAGDFTVDDLLCVSEIGLMVDQPGDRQAPPRRARPRRIPPRRRLVGDG